MSLAKQLKRFDSFASPVATINLKGDESIRTVPGALITIITYAFLLYVATLSFLGMIDHQNNKINAYEVQQSSEVVQELGLNMHEQRLDVAIGMFNPVTLEWLLHQEDYLQVQVIMRSSDIVASTVVEEEELKLELCTENAYYEGLSDGEKAFVQAGVCVDDDEYGKTNLVGAPGSVKSRIYEIRVSRCHGKPSCRSDAEIEEYITTYQLFIHSAQVVVDYDFHENPEQIAVNFLHADSIRPINGNKIHKLFGLEQNTFIRKDQWYNFFEGEIESTFLSYSAQSDRAINPLYMDVL